MGAGRTIGMQQLEGLYCGFATTERPVKLVDTDGCETKNR